MTRVTSKIDYYDLKSSINEAKSYKFSKGEKLKPKRNNTPGPGRYNI